MDHGLVFSELLRRCPSPTLRPPDPGSQGLWDHRSSICVACGTSRLAILRGMIRAKVPTLVLAGQMDPDISAARAG